MGRRKRRDTDIQSNNLCTSMCLEQPLDGCVSSFNSSLLSKPKDCFFFFYFSLSPATGTVFAKNCISCSCLSGDTYWNSWSTKT